MRSNGSWIPADEVSIPSVNLEIRAASGTRNAGGVDFQTPPTPTSDLCHLFPLLDESFMQFTDNVIFRTLAQGRSFVRRLEVQSGEFVILFVWQGPLVISAFDAVSPWSGRLRNLLHSRASGRRVPERALLAVSSTHLFRRSYALEFHAARPREGEIRRRSSDFCPSDSNSHLWLRDFDADAQT